MNNTALYHHATSLSTKSNFKYMQEGSIRLIFFLDMLYGVAMLCFVMPCFIVWPLNCHGRQQPSYSFGHVANFKPNPKKDSNSHISDGVGWFLFTFIFRHTTEALFEVLA